MDQAGEQISPWVQQVGVDPRFGQGAAAAQSVPMRRAPLASGPLFFHFQEGFATQGAWIMSESGPKRIGVSIEVPPHAYDPATQPELFDGVLARRVVAFFVDFIILAVPVLFATIFILIFGVVTFGLGWLLFWLLWPATIAWVLLYYAFTLGGPHSATIGMRVMDLQMRLWYGAPVYHVLGAMHVVVFWLTISFLTPLVLLVGFFNERRRLLHDMLVGTIVINNDIRAKALRAGRPMG